MSIAIFCCRGMDDACCCVFPIRRQSEASHEQDADDDCYTLLLLRLDDACRSFHQRDADQEQEADHERCAVLLLGLE